MEFDKNKILTCVTGGTEWIGKKGWFADLIGVLRIKVTECSPHTLQAFDSSSVCPFQTEDGYPYVLFYPAPEQTYAERQAEWVKANAVEIGTKVRFIKGFEDSEDGSDCCGHENAKGKKGTVITINSGYVFVGIPSIGGWAVPFTALEVIKEPSYRPYNNDELNDLVGEVLTNKQSGRRKLVTGKPTASEGVNLDGSYISARDLLSSFYRNTNEPCGVRKEA